MSDSKKKPSPASPPEKQLTLLNIKKESQDLISNLYAELAIQQRKLQEKALKKLKASNIQSRKSAEGWLPFGHDEENSEVPIDGDVIQGSRLYTRECMSCHTLDPNSLGKHSTGPALGLIVNRKIAADRYFQGYSDASLKSEIFWTPSNLFKFMKNPKQFLPGSKCNFTNKQGGIKSVEDRADIIKLFLLLHRFLKSYTKQMSHNMKVKAASLHGQQYMKTQISVEKQKTTRRRQRMQMRDNPPQ